MQQTRLFLTVLADYWTWALGSIISLITIAAAWRKWRADALTKARIEIKQLKGDNAKLTREALIRIDDLQDQYRQIDELQMKIIEQRERAQRLIDLERPKT
jgi:hypothetical protein